jgi:hypothetical protein
MIYTPIIGTMTTKNDGVTIVIAMKEANMAREEDRSWPREEGRDWSIASRSLENLRL